MQWIDLIFQVHGVVSMNSIEFQSKYFQSLLSKSKQFKYKLLISTFFYSSLFHHLGRHSREENTIFIYGWRYSFESNSRFIYYHESRLCWSNWIAREFESSLSVNRFVNLFVFEKKENACLFSQSMRYGCTRFRSN